MNYSLHREAEAELYESAQYYENEKKNLGVELLEEVDRTLERIIENPRQFPRISRNLRRALVNRFQYGLIFSDDDDRVFVVAVMHLRRRPGYWKNRLP